MINNSGNEIETDISASYWEEMKAHIKTISVSMIYGDVRSSYAYKSPQALLEDMLEYGTLGQR